MTSNSKEKKISKVNHFTIGWQKMKPSNITKTLAPKESPEGKNMQEEEPFLTMKRLHTLKISTQMRHLMFPHTAEKVVRSSMELMSFLENNTINEFTFIEFLYFSILLH